MYIGSGVCPAAMSLLLGKNLCVRGRSGGVRSVSVWYMSGVLICIFSQSDFACSCMYVLIGGMLHSSCRDCVVRNWSHLVLVINFRALFCTLCSDRNDVLDSVFIGMTGYMSEGLTIVL